MMNYYWRSDGGQFWSGHGFNWLFILLIGLILILVLAKLLSWLFESDNNHNHNHNTIPNENNVALNIAKERYARGEVTKEQFDQLKKDL